MARILVEVVLPFLAPFVLVFGYRLLVTRGQAFLASTPWYRLTVAGLALACLSLAAQAFLGGDDPAGRYVPARIENGRIVPGHVEARPVESPR